MNYEQEIHGLIELLIRENASDLHLSAGTRPTIRVNGALTPLESKQPLSGEDTMGIASVLLSQEQRQEFLETQEFDFSYSYQDKVRFRCNAYFQQGTVSIAMRLIPQQIRTLEDLQLPDILRDFALRQQGFFLVVGPVGQGKSTTLATMIDIINQERTKHIVTIEDPIEYKYEQKQSVIDQREVRIDTQNFGTALRSVFRQDVDVIMVGEMRALETMSTAVTAAETGHLVLSTLHTNNAAQTIDRIIDSFPPGQQEQIRIQLAASLLGVFSQRLLPRVSGGLIPAYELLINNHAVANLIRERRTHEINTIIETGMEDGMIDMNRSLADLVRRGEVSVENAFSRSFNPKSLERML